MITYNISFHGTYAMTHRELKAQPKKRISGTTFWRNFTSSIFREIRWIFLWFFGCQAQAGHHTEPFYLSTPGITGSFGNALGRFIGCNVLHAYNTCPGHCGILINCAGISMRKKFANRLLSDGNLILDRRLELELHVCESLFSVVLTCYLWYGLVSGNNSPWWAYQWVLCLNNIK